MTDPIRSIPALRETVAQWKQDGKRIGLVPTMGALHDGHLSLIDTAWKNADQVIVSLFVNPAQFAPGEDFHTYPRDTDSDRRKLAPYNVHLYMPTTETMYPDGFTTEIRVPRLAQGMEGDARPQFFTGVATIVAKLLIQCLPDVMIAGEKDYQQLLVIRQLARDMNIPGSIIAAPTIRDDDGLALSSRNAGLSDSERSIAPRLNAALHAVADGTPPDVAIRTLLKAGFDSVDYLEIRDADSLAPVTLPVKRPARILTAATLGKTRLIDNIPLPPDS